MPGSPIHHSQFYDLTAESSLPGFPLWKPISLRKEFYDVPKKSLLPSHQSAQLLESYIKRNTACTLPPSYLKSGEWKNHANVHSFFQECIQQGSL
jgi:hypothetical protein